MPTFASESDTTEPYIATHNQKFQKITIETSSKTALQTPQATSTSTTKLIPRASNTTMSFVTSTTTPTSSSTISSKTSMSTGLLSSTLIINNKTSLSVTSTRTSVNISATTHSNKNKDSMGLHISAGTALGIFLIVLILVSVGSIIFYYIKKKGNLSCQRCRVCLTRRRRRSSTSSRGPLTQDDATFVHITDHPRPERELFSIGDPDGGEDGRPTPMHRRGTEDDYFYDEIFGKSAFVDETTNRANTHLTVDDEDDNELHIPDLVFKKPKRI